jgi:type II secretory pathway component PulJ
MAVVALLVAVCLFALGVLVGATWADELGDARSRRQAAKQRELNEQAARLRRMAWVLSQRTRQQANVQTTEPFFIYYEDVD